MDREMIRNLDERKARLRALMPSLTEAQIANVLGPNVLPAGSAFRVPLMFADAAPPVEAYQKDGAMTLNDSLGAVPDEFRCKYNFVSGMMASHNPAVMEDAARQAEALAARMKTYVQLAGGSGLTMDSDEKTALGYLADHLSGEAAAVRATAARVRAGGAR
jgi:hypothetical protein